MDPLTALGLGITLGSLAGLVPGLHTNTVVTLLVAFALPDPILLVAVAASHAMLATLPATFLGVPAENGHLGILPAHRLLLQGKAREAVRTAVQATLAAGVLAVLLLLPFKWLWVQPGNGARLVAPLLPWVIAGVPFWLAWRERSKGARAVAWGVAIFLLAGALGVVATRIPATALVAVPAATLGALLSGLFGGAALVAAAVGGRLLTEQDAPQRPSRRLRWRLAAAVCAGVVASAATALVPGATPALVASATPRARDARGAVASLAAVGAAQPLFAVALLWLNGQARSGLAQGIQATASIQPWQSGRAPTMLLAVLAAWLAAALAGAGLARGLEAPVARWLPRVPQRPLAVAALLVLAGVCLLVAGPVGALLFVAGTMLGLVPMAAGVRRVHLIGALLVPVLLGR